MANSQAPIQCDIYMKLLYGITTMLGHAKDNILKFLQNIHGQKQATHMWNGYLVLKLIQIGF